MATEKSENGIGTFDEWYEIHGRTTWGGGLLSLKRQYQTVWDAARECPSLGTWIPIYRHQQGAFVVEIGTRSYNGDSQGNANG